MRIVLLTVDTGQGMILVVVVCSCLMAVAVPYLVNRLIRVSASL